MKQLGPNLYHGNYDDIVALRNLTRLAEDKKRDDQRRLKSMLPSDRFFKVASDTWRKPMGATYPWTYQAQEYGLVEFSRIKQKNFPDIDRISDFVIQLRSLYIVDLYQGQGIGRKIIEPPVRFRKCGNLVLWYTHLLEGLPLVGSTRGLLAGLGFFGFALLA